MADSHVLSALKAACVIPNGVNLCTLAMNEILTARKADPSWIKAHFSELVAQIQIRAYDKYLEAEKPAAAKAFKSVFGELLPKNPKPEDFFAVLEENFASLDKFFLSLTQSRRSRAGSVFEHIVKVLFDKLDYPYTPQAVINGVPDFLMPSEEHYRKNPMDCIIFTVKRTLRERWRQITTEGTRGHMFFLATIDENVSSNSLKEMKKSRIYLVLPEAIRKAHYAGELNAISFEAFFKHHLDPAIERWRDDGVVR